MCEGCTDGTVSTCPQCPVPPYPSIDPLMAHGHTLTAVAALHPVFSSPDTAAQVSEPEQWPETVEVGVPEVRGSAAATSLPPILIESPCGCVLCYTQEGFAVGR